MIVFSLPQKSAMQFEILFLALIPAGFSMLLDYALGFPGKEQVNPKAIFFCGWSFKLAKRRLINSGRYQEILDQMNDSGYQDPEGITLTIFMEGRKRFTWEQVLGMCSFCTNFWISLIAAFIMIFTVQHNFLLVLLIPIFSHLYLRILKNY